LILHENVFFDEKTQKCANFKTNDIVKVKRTFMHKTFRKQNFLV